MSLGGDCAGGEDVGTVEDTAEQYGTALVDGPGVILGSMQGACPTEKMRVAGVIVNDAAITKRSVFDLEIIPSVGGVTFSFGERRGDFVDRRSEK